MNEAILSTILEIIKYLLPALVIVIVLKQAFEKWFTYLDRKAQFELQLKRVDQVLPIRLQAYERLTLLLERLSPDNLVNRTSDSDMNVGELQYALIISIRAECEHNLSQQIYVSDMAWQAVKTAREQLISLISQTAKTLDSNEPSINLSRLIISTGINPTLPAIAYVKAEALTLLGA